MPRKSAKREASTASPDPAAPTPVKASKSSNSTPAKSASSKKNKDAAATPVGTKTPKAPKTPKDKDTPAKQRRQSIKTPRSSSSSSATDKHGNGNGNGNGSASSPRKAPLAGLPPAAKFVAVEAVTLALLVAGRFALAAATGNELGGLRAAPESNAELALLVGWRAAEVALAWAANLDFVDVGLVSFVAHAPAFWLIATFYNISPATALGGALVDVAAPAAAFALARSPSSLRSAGPRLYNRDLVAAPFRLLIGALATSVYAAVISLALRFALPRVLVLHFRGIPTVAPAYGASFAGVLPTAALFGVAAAGFLFAPYVTTGRSREDERIKNFDPVRATLGETVWWNVWGYTLRSRIVITRTVLITAITAVSTYLACAVAIDGVTGLGAAAYASVWALATGATGLALGLVGQE